MFVFLELQHYKEQLFKVLEVYFLHLKKNTTLLLRSSKWVVWKRSQRSISPLLLEFHWPLATSFLVMMCFSVCLCWLWVIQDPVADVTFLPVKAMGVSHTSHTGNVFLLTILPLFPIKSTKEIVIHCYTSSLQFSLHISVNQLVPQWFRKEVIDYMTGRLVPWPVLRKMLKTLFTFLFYVLALNMGTDSVTFCFFYKIEIIKKKENGQTICQSLSKVYFH